MIKKRNLDPSLIQWINQMGVSPFAGDIKFALRDNSAGTRNYKTMLYEMGVKDENLFVGTTAPALAYAACTAGQGDTVVVFPGWYNIGTGLNMNKRDTHMVGASAIPQIGMWGSPAVIYTSVTTTSLGYSILMSAEQNSLRNLSVTAYGDHALQKSALKITSSNMYLKNLTTFNFGGATIAGTANACDLWIDGSTAGAGAASVFEDCIIGNIGTSKRTSTSSAVILFGTTGGVGSGKNVTFKRCKILSTAETAGIPLIHYAANYTVDGFTLFDECLLMNYWVNMADNINYALDDDCGTTHYTIFKDCALIGVDAYANVNTYAFTTIANAESDGGKGIAVDTTP